MNKPSGSISILSVVNECMDQCMNHGIQILCLLVAMPAIIVTEKNSRAVLSVLLRKLTGEPDMDLKF